MARHTRRQFVQTTVLGFGAYLTTGAGLGCKRGAKTTDAAAPSPAVDGGVRVLRVLTPEQFLTVSAACECILPRDEDPGAVDLGVPYYIDGQLADPNLEDWRKPFLGGLAVLDRQSRKLHGKRFHELGSEEQNQLLARWQAGASGETRFFQILMNLTFEGAFGDPVHGGNKDRQGFTMVGFIPGPPLPDGSAHTHHH
ncbi:MAG: gluconate 2-dehydrogenase subunit 3 family protein [Deltaproteobacteria bacterium]|nr:gluconate 2-dehydrogenase subunit 3 family protein [Deltaproteobacteria bacterium]